MEYAEQHFKLQQPVGSSSGGASMAAHLRQLAKSKGQDEDEFITQFHEQEGAPAEAPWELEWHWHVFLLLDSARQSGGNGPAAISYGEIESWVRLHLYGLLLNPWEVQLLRDLDLVWLEAWHGRSRTTGTPGQKPGSGGRRPTIGGAGRGRG